MKRTNVVDYDQLIFIQKNNIKQYFNQNQAKVS